MAENTKETKKNQSDFSCFNNKIWPWFSAAQRFDFVRETTIEKSKKKKKFQKPEYGEKYVFLAKCIESAGLREKYCQQKR